MNKYRILCFLIILHLPDIGYTQIRSTIPPTHLNLPTLIIFSQSDGRAATGSGFIYRSNDDIYLCTAKHVLVDPSTNLIRGKYFRLYIPADDITDTTQNILNINLGFMDSVGLVLRHQVADLVLVRFGYSLGTRVYLHDSVMVEQNAKSGISLRDKQMMTSYSDVIIGNDVYLYGYPISIGSASLHQFDNMRPLLRKGIIGGKYEKRNTIILDCPIYYGNSGGPVVQQSIDSQGENKFKIIGVDSQWIPFDQSKIGVLPPNTVIDNSGYSVVESTDRILELMDEVRK